MPDGDHYRTRRGTECRSRRMSRLGRQRSLGRGAVITAIVLFACLDWVPSARGALHAAGQDCAGCHPAEANKWRNSDHDLSMQEPIPSAVLGRFNGQTIALAELSVTPSRRGNKWFFDVSDAAGSKRYVLRYVFGHAPLQQYLLEADKGRLVVAPIAWDITTQRWFDPSINGAQGQPSDPLHWSGLAGTWNHMCSDCHSTNVDKGYDFDSDRYQTTFSKIDVSCTACHGQGESLANLSTQKAEIETCAKCHSHREQIAPGHTPGSVFLDHYQPALLDSDVYHPDGQIKPEHEAFVYGSFLQSKMYRHGVRCSDCHDVHSGTLKAEGNALCTQCHSTSQFDTTLHHQHPSGSAGAQCVNCHMPATTYMGVDSRRDHHIRVPDRQASAQLGTPNACANCHSQSAMGDGMFSPRSNLSSRFGVLVAQGRVGDPGAGRALRLAATDEGLDSFRRASAIALLKKYPPTGDEREVRKATRDEDPLVRMAAARTLGLWGVHAADVLPLMDDPVRAVRFAAIRHPAIHHVAGRERLKMVLEEWEAASISTADIASTHTNLAVVHSRFGNHDRAIDSLRKALHLDPEFIPALRNLAVLLLKKGETQEAEYLWLRAKGHSIHN
jgi:predicted CXXCH cytochrome family protein